MFHIEDGVSRIFQNVSVFQTKKVGIPEDNVFPKHGSQNLQSHTNVSWLYQVFPLLGFRTL
jgi:hypothetical protein